MCIGQAFLQRAEQCQFHHFRHADCFRVLCQIRVGMTKIRFNHQGAALAKAIDKPVRGRFEARLIEQRRMQQIRHGSNAGHGTVDKVASFLQHGRVLSPILNQSHIQIDLSRCQPLAKTIVQFSRDAAPFLVLHPHQPGGELVQRHGPLFHQRLQLVVGPA